MFSSESLVLFRAASPEERARNSADTTHAHASVCVLIEVVDGCQVIFCRIAYRDQQNRVVAALFEKTYNICPSGCQINKNVMKTSPTAVEKMEKHMPLTERC